MITIRKKLAEQAAMKQEREDRASGGKELKRRQSFRSQLLTSGKYFIIIFLYFDFLSNRGWRIRRDPT